MAHVEKILEKIVFFQENLSNFTTSFTYLVNVRVDKLYIFLINSQKYIEKPEISMILTMNINVICKILIHI